MVLLNPPKFTGRNPRSHSLSISSQDSADLLTYCLGLVTVLSRSVLEEPMEKFTSPQAAYILGVFIILIVVVGVAAFRVGFQSGFSHLEKLHREIMQKGRQHK